MSAKLDITTTVQRAVLRAYDNLIVRSAVTPTVSYGGADSDWNNLYAHATAILQAIGASDAKADLNPENNKSSFNVRVAVSNSTLYGANVSIDAKNSLKFDAVADGSDLTNKKHRLPDDVNKTTSTQVSNCIFYIGDAAAGIVIDISGKPEEPTVREVGLKNERAIWTLVGDTLVFKDISNPLPGRLTMKSVSWGDTRYVDVSPTSGFTIYDQNYLPSVTIVNRTSLSLRLGAIVTENENYLNPSINGRSAEAEKSSSILPTIEVESRSDGDVIVGGLIANPRGSVSFKWTDPDRHGSLLTAREQLTTTSTSITVAPIWAHEFNVSGAESVGGTGNGVEHFNVFACWHDGKAPLVSVTAVGDIKIAVTDVLIAIVSDLSNYSKVSHPSPTVSNIVGGDTTDILVNVPLTMYREAKSS
ncbi:MAG: hypothetical protein ACRC75_08550, partial [Olsenella sp.]